MVPLLSYEAEPSRVMDTLTVPVRLGPALATGKTFGRVVVVLDDDVLLLVDDELLLVVDEEVLVVVDDEVLLLVEDVLVDVVVVCLPAAAGCASESARRAGNTPKNRPLAIVIVRYHLLCPCSEVGTTLRKQRACRSLRHTPACFRTTTTHPDREPQRLISQRSQGFTGRSPLRQCDQGLSRRLRTNSLFVLRRYDIVHRCLQRTARGTAPAQTHTSVACARRRAWRRLG